MTEKRFEVVMNEFDEVEYIMDKEMMEDRDFADFIDFVEDVCKENEQLKQQFNYIQNSISEHIKHQKTELGQKALQEIIREYNEWLLGHKRLQE